TRHDLGREQFQERVWQWKDHYADSIRDQFRALGCSFDWTRERFTMDAGYVDAVLEFFIRLFDEGKIYRGWRVINWCPRCQSAISDIEVENIERQDPLYYLRYPLQDGSGDIVVATVRPETILGDVAVAVNPNDDRYTRYVGKVAILPLIGRELRIVADDMVDKEFGTGAVKITPAHDFADFEVAERHNLDRPIALSPDGRVTSVGGPYRGQTVLEARESVLHDLQAGGYLVKTENHQHVVPTCERCHTVLEPLLSEQWFMDMSDLAGPAIDVVKNGSVRFVPERWSKVYLDWMENIRPWTLSRQLWWGHRIPIYYCENGHATAAKSAPQACRICGSPIVRQDEDVLDTWFSSALWPFATLGLPERTDDLERFYPTSFMNTSSQILYLWIARMIMTGLKFMHDVPFPVVLINPTIQTAEGRRMSKSLGTGADPLLLVEQFGADALRFGLITAGSTHQQDIRFLPERFEEMRNFTNKLWNVARAVLRYQEVNEPKQELRLSTADRWILSRLAVTTDRVTSDMERFELSAPGNRLYEFVWSEFADWYLEAAKVRFFDTSSSSAGSYASRAVLWSVLERVCRLLHPYMPFVTEEIWQHLRTTGSDAARKLSGWDGPMPESVMVAPWPDAGEPDVEAEREMQLVMDIIRATRTARSEYGKAPGAWISASIVAGPQRSLLRGSFDVISNLARLRPLAVYEVIEEKPKQAVSLLVGDVTVYIPLQELTDLDAERKRIEKELQGTEKALESLKAKLLNASFVAKAPDAVVERERARAAELAERARRLQERLELLSE
ncbi:MAG TPA: valine--tRNA ligase, partial [Chloroflexota bacterium]